MKALLMYRDQDFDLQLKSSAAQDAMVKDLELNTLVNAMALGDEFIFMVCKQAVLSSLHDTDTILYRQNVLKDCLKNPAIVKDIYNIAVEAINEEKKHFWGLLSKSPDSILSRSIKVLQMFVEKLNRLRNVADQHAGKFCSEGFTAFFTMLRKELDDDYLASVKVHLKELKFRGGVLISADLGTGNKGINYVLRKPNSPFRKRGCLWWLFGVEPPDYAYYISDRDDAGFRAIGELKNRGINTVANALAQSAEHILGFFHMLRSELAFYLGCLNLHRQLEQKGEPMCFPQPMAAGTRNHLFEGLYDVCLALIIKERTVGNDLYAEKKDLVIITGANQGGKSTFLRSMGLSQLMMQCGMFVPASSFRASVCHGLFTHYKREEDATMNSGKLDEELSRMNDIVSDLKTGSLVLFNESFAATNEREGSEIARQIICALIEKGIRVFYVTHLYEFASSWHDRHMENVLFLRAERQADGRRTFKMVAGEPLQTSFGQDIYSKIFGADCS